MAKAELIIKNNVQDVGYRLFVMERILESPLQGGAINQSDGTVKVLLEGKEEDIFVFVEKLKKEFPELAKNPALLGPKFDETFVVPNKLELSQALQMNQFSKAVVYLEKMAGKLDSMNGKFDFGFGKIGEKLDKIDKNFEKFPGEISERLGEKIDRLPGEISERLGEKIDRLPGEISERLGEKIDRLPGEISEKLGEKIDRLPGEISEKLGEKIDRLPREIAKAIKGA